MATAATHDSNQEAWEMAGTFVKEQGITKKKITIYIGHEEIRVSDCF